MKNIIYYTISSNNYSSFTNLMLSSFTKYSNNKIFILSIDEIQNQFIDTRVQYITVPKTTLSQVPNNIWHKYICWWLKSQCNLIPNIFLDDQIICFLDSDILFFSDPSVFIHNNILDNTIFYVSNDSKILNDRSLLNSGFFYADNRGFPLESLMIEWSRVMLDGLISLNDLRKNDRLFFKYLDQIALRKVVKNFPFNNIKLLDPMYISYARKRPHCVLNHYIKGKKYNMSNDYEKFIKNSYHQ